MTRETDATAVKVELVDAGETCKGTSASETGRYASKTCPIDLVVEIGTTSDAN